MDLKATKLKGFQPDQEILDARGISMTIEEVVNLSKAEYSDRFRCLNLSKEDVAFVKGLRRRIKNRMASQNSRRRTLEKIRTLTSDISAARSCKAGIEAERDLLRRQMSLLVHTYDRLQCYVIERLQESEVSGMQEEVARVARPPRRAPPRRKQPAPRRKQPAPRKVNPSEEYSEDVVLDLKIKKDPDVD